MPEVKNNFIKGKMNKDLDERLLSDGEYRDARNLSTSSSDTGNAGSLENVLGNLELTDFDLTDRGLEIIGYQTDAATDRIFVFLTNYNDSSSDALSNFAPSTSSHYIAAYSVRSKSYSILVQGSFLNFSKTHPVLSVNILEDLLFWNDNRNQPRKINIQTALSKSSSIATDPHYYLEEQISVAKYYPYNPMRLFKAGDGIINGYNSDLMGSITTLPDFSGDGGASDGAHVITFNGFTSPFTGFSGGTTNECNLTITVLSDVIVSISVTTTGIPSQVSFAVGDELVVDAVAPFNSGSKKLVITIRDVDLSQVSTMYDASSEDLPISETAEIITAASTGDTFDVTYTGSDSLLQYINCLIYIKDSSGEFTTSHSDGIFLSDLVDIGGGDFTLILSGSVSFDPTYEITIGANPYYSTSNGNNSEIISDKFARFSYRFRYEDDEYSLIAPFTQPAFIPKQDGYFMSNDGAIDSNEQDALKSTIVEFMENKVNQIEFQIDLPEGITEAKDLETVLKVKEVEILMKESDSPALKVIDSIKPEDLSQSDDNKIQYLFSSSSSIKTLPESDITRVYDKVPVRALSQEIIGNRVIYGNYLPWKLAPESLDYNLEVSEKKTQSEGIDFFSRREYPNHSLKQNRTYQVGVVLADKFGRQSDVILSSDSTIYSPFRDINLSVISAGDIYSGDSLKVIFENPIPSSYFKNGYAGLYDADSNPLGWYSYKIVVKQQEQSYYNVYAPTVLNDYPKDAGSKSADTAHITLLGDNINKVPRDLSEVSQLDTVFRSSTQLYPRVITSSQAASDTHDAIRYDNQNKSDKVVLIGDKLEMGLDKDEGGVAYTDSPFYSIPNMATNGSNPLIGRMSTNQELGSLGGKTTATAISELSFDNVSLNVLETKPIYSNLDVFWETTTSGLISELNDNINSDTDTETYAVGLSTLGYKLTEESLVDDIVSSQFYAIDYAGNQITTGVTITIESIENRNGNSFLDRFELVDNTGGFYSIKNKYDKWVYVSDKNIENDLTFKFRIVVNVTTALTTIISVSDNMLQNILPWSNKDGYNYGSLKEGSPYSKRGAWDGWEGNSLVDIDYSNGSIGSEKQKETTLRVINLEYYWGYNSTWQPYFSPAIGENGGSTYPLVDTVRLFSSGGADLNLQISRNVRALKISKSRAWYKVRDRDENWAIKYPDVTAAEDTPYRVELQITDADGQGLSHKFYVYFTLTEY
tara:strand:- start:25927 stop:29559 length:3633 start_codon:yes stop_codon:yes gene_type:complete